MYSAILISGLVKAHKFNSQTRLVRSVGCNSDLWVCSCTHCDVIVSLVSAHSHGLKGTQVIQISKHIKHTLVNLLKVLTAALFKSQQQSCNLKVFRGLQKLALLINHKLLFVSKWRDSNKAHCYRGKRGLKKYIKGKYFV